MHPSLRSLKTIIDLLDKSIEEDKDLEEDKEEDLVIEEDLITEAIKDSRIINEEDLTDSNKKIILIIFVVILVLVFRFDQWFQLTLHQLGHSY